MYALPWGPRTGGGFLNRLLLNTLFVQTQGAYLRLEGDTVRVEVEGAVRLQVPLHHLGGLVLFGNVLVSPFLLARCAEDGRLKTCTYSPRA
ncbi:CRISPR-associated endonuclease Cas1 [Thermus arciformis]|uniref:CRISPR-associated endonuclease Cas1 n=1 Tax=Thermus arciformis TaxID=482827 RepID=UPI002456236F|nr:CRISPR-associated endonuclease Cas1 [Thermus arciformis]